MAVSPVLPADWTAILDNVQKALVQAQEEAERSAQALDAPLANPAGAAQTEAAWEQGLAGIDEQVRQLQVNADCADQKAAAAEAALEESEEALKQWLATAQAIRRKLADQA